MYEVTAVYHKRFKEKIIKQTYKTDSYDEAMSQLREYFTKNRIPESRIINYQFVKIIQCPQCAHILRLTKSVNQCECGRVYTFTGDLARESITP